ncbi:TPA: hypothetical protein RMI67_005277 [Bacillus cereus]|nr:hypothetical protein [Bacillus cereus]
MTKKLFTEREIQILSNNLYVKSVSQKGITYTEEFKHIFIEGVPPAFRKKTTLSKK